MKKNLIPALYIVLCLVAMAIAAGAPIPWSGSGGGSFLNSFLLFP
jgi:hypothetical protein